MQFTRNAKVYTYDRQWVGHITHVVLDPDSKKVTHIVVRRGIILKEDKVLSIEMIQSSYPEGVILREDVGDVHHLPPFEEAHYMEVDLPVNMDTGWLASTHGGAYLSLPGGPVPYDHLTEKPTPKMIHRSVHTLDKNIPAGEVALKEGAAVISADDQRVGYIESILVDPQTDRVTNIVVAKHVLLTTVRRLVPTAWIHSVSEDTVYLTVDAAALMTCQSMSDQRY